MKIAALTYQYTSQDNLSGDNRARLEKKHALTTFINNSSKKTTQQRQSSNSDLSSHVSKTLPRIRTNEQRRNSMLINGSSLASSKAGDRRTYSFLSQARSHSRQSNRSEHIDANSRSNTPGATSRSNSRLVRMKFGYPIQLRSANFYGPDKSDDELHLREDTYVNDSVRSAHQSHRVSIIPSYNALNDPHLRRFFQSPIVLDIVRKTLNTDVNPSSKQDDKSSKIYKIKKRSKSNDPYDEPRHDYQRIVTKGSSGYAKLNGYDCIPSYSPARHDRRRSKTIGPSVSNLSHYTNRDSRASRDRLVHTSTTNYTTSERKNSKQTQHEKTKYTLEQLVRNTTGNINAS